MCSMGGGGAAGRKVMRVLMVAMLPGFVEAAGLVRDACKAFGTGAFVNGCNFAMTRTPAECDAECVRHRLPDCCVARALHHLGAAHARSCADLFYCVLTLRFHLFFSSLFDF